MAIHRVRGEGAMEVTKVTQLERNHPELAELLDASLDELLKMAVEQTIGPDIVFPAGVEGRTTGFIGDVPLAENAHAAEAVQIIKTVNGTAAIYQSWYKGVAPQPSDPIGSWGIFVNKNNLAAFYWSAGRHGQNLGRFIMNPRRGYRLPQPSYAAELMTWHLAAGLYLSDHPEAKGEFGVSQIPPPRPQPPTPDPSKL